MSLAFGEQQALAAIETELRKSDPRFAAMLAYLAKQLPPGQGPGPARHRSWRPPGLTGWPRPLARSRSAASIVMLAIVVAVFIACCVVGAVVASQAGHGGLQRGQASTSQAAPRGQVPRDQDMAFHG